MSYRNLTNETPQIDPKLLPTQPTRRTALVRAVTPAEQKRHNRSARNAAAAETIQMLVTPTSQPQQGARLDVSSPTRQPITVFTPSDGATERTTAMDRAQATVYRMHPMTVILALLATGLALWMQFGLGLALCIFAVTAVAGYGYFNITDYRYSRAGLERHRISMATQLERQRMGHEKELKAMALESLIQLHEARGIDYAEGELSMANDNDPRDVTIAQLRRENRYLRSKVGDRPIGLKNVNTIGRILRRALDDAISLLTLREANYQITRALANEIGISERRYYWAIGLIRSAGVMRNHQWRVTDYNAACEKLKIRYQELNNRGDALEMLRLYMPKKMAYMYAGKG